MDIIKDVLCHLVACHRGAPMGRGDITPADTQGARRFYLRLLPIDSGGYDPGGAYWGHYHLPMYGAFSRHDDKGGELPAATMYFRAASRDEAKKTIEARYPGARFYDGARYPVVPDGRYSIALEYCGEATPQWIARFCDDWLGAFSTLDDAESAASEHREPARRAIGR